MEEGEARDAFREQITSLCASQVERLGGGRRTHAARGASEGMTREYE